MSSAHDGRPQPYNDENAPAPNIPELLDYIAEDSDETLLYGDDENLPEYKLGSAPAPRPDVNIKSIAKAIFKTLFIMLIFVLFLCGLYFCFPDILETLKDTYKSVLDFLQGKYF